MRSLKKVGWFGDLPHGIPGSQTAAEATNHLPTALVGEVARYLDAGSVVAVAGIDVHDCLSSNRELISADLRTLSDGEYVWPSDLSFYVRRYRVGLPDDFIRRVFDGPPAMLSDDDIDEIVDALLS